MRTNWAFAADLSNRFFGGLPSETSIVALYGSAWLDRPTLSPALLVGILTVVAPLFILQPALGAGIASRKTATPLFNAGKSVVTHTVYGAGLFISALVIAHVS